MNAKFKKPTTTNLLLIPLLSTTLIAACSAPKAPPLTVPEGAQAGELLDLEPCTYKSNDVEYAADCGILVVPENRTAPNSHLIELPKTRVHSTGTAPTEPIFVLPGGPGLSNYGISQRSLVRVQYCLQELLSFEKFFSFLRISPNGKKECLDRLST